MSLGKRDVPVSVMVSEKERDLLTEAAHRVGESRSTFMRKPALRRAVEIARQLSEEPTDEEQREEVG